MWAQLIKMQLKPGEGSGEMTRAIRAAEQPGSGLVRTLTMRDQRDPRALYSLVVFESEEKARAREQDPRRQEGLQSAREIMAEIFEGPPAFTDLEVVEEWTDGGRMSAGERAPMRRIHVTARFPSIPHDRLDEFKTLAARALEITRGEAGTLRYDWFFDEDASACVVWEEYEDSDAVLAHVAGLGGLLGQLLEVGGGCTFEVCGRPSRELVAATAGLELTVFPSFFQGR